MDRRSWLWRKRSSEKSPGETESSGSMSSYSERLSDEQANITHNAQSPELIASTAIPDNEENEKIKALTEKLSAALLNITAKEELVIQHSKVAEEAVAGWESADREASGLKSQLDAALKKNSALEDRVSHLDGALKECVRQLRQGKEEQERKIEEAIAKREHEWESRKSEIENQMSELRTQLEATKSEVVVSASMEAAEREKASLFKKLEIMTLERDLSTQSAENASKQHLESIKKVAKLEAECRRLRLLTRKASLFSEHRSFTASSVTDSQSDYGERLQALEADVHDKVGSVDQNECESSHIVTRSSEIVLMDDFLEMERVAALPDTANGPDSLELEAMMTRNADLEEKIRRLEAEKMELEMALNESHSHFSASVELEGQLSECQAQLRTSQGQLKATKTELNSLQHELFECRDQLRTSQAKLKSTETELIELQTQLIEYEDQLSASEAHLKDAEAKLEELQNQLFEREDQLKASQGQLEDAEAELRKLKTRLFERGDLVKTYQGQLEDAEAEVIKLKAQLLAREEEVKRSQGKVNDIESQLQEMQTRLIEYEDGDTKLVELQTELALVNKLKEGVEGQLEASNAQREEAELQVKSLLAKVESLVDEADKERALSAEITARCRKLDDELSRSKVEPQFQLEWNCNADMEAEQEKELEVAASRLEDCQKTIASLGRQLQSLATLDDFLVDADSSLEFTGESPIFFRTGELGNPPSIDCQ